MEIAQPWPVRRDRIAGGFLCSVALHAAGLLALLHLGVHLDRDRAAHKHSVVSLELRHLPAEGRGRVVETQRVAPVREPAPFAFLGRQTQVPDRQTKARNLGFYSDGGAGAASAGSSSPAARSLRRRIALSSLGLPISGRVTPTIFPQSSGGAASDDDDFPNVPDGAQTLLNTRQYAYYSFYQRVRQQIEQFWEPELHRRLRRMSEQGRVLASATVCVTWLSVYLDAKGEITRITVRDTSGVREVDEAAIDAFNTAGEFPNPPRALLGSDGLIRVDWKFMLKT